MRILVNSIELRRGRQLLAIGLEAGVGPVRYIGSINGRPCVSSPTKAGAVNALLRRLAYAPLL